MKLSVSFCVLTLTKALLNERVGCQRNALLFYLAISTLVDELPHRLQVGVTEGQKPHTSLTAPEQVPNLRHLLKNITACLTNSLCINMVNLIVPHPQAM